MPSGTYDYLKKLADARTDQIIVTTMTSAKTWPALSDSDLDFNYLPSAMSHAGDVALGFALARTERTVVCINGDGSLLMNLGSLISIADSGVANYRMIVLANGTYDVVGGAGVPGTGLVDFAAMATAAGWPMAVRCQDADAFAEALPEFLAGPGPAMAMLNSLEAPDAEYVLPQKHPRDALRALRARFAT